MIRRNALSQAVANRLTSNRQRRFWILIFLVGVLLCAIQTVNLFAHYKTYPVVLKSEVELQIPIQFPSVTVCVNVPCSLRCTKKNTNSNNGSAGTMAKKTPDAILNSLAHLSEHERFISGERFVISQYGHGLGEKSVSFYTNNLYYGNCMTLNGGTPDEEKAAESRVIMAIVPNQVHRKYKDAWRSRSHVILVHEPDTAPVFINPKNMAVGYPGDVLNLIVSKRDFVLKPSPYMSECIERRPPEPMNTSGEFRSIVEDPLLYTMEGCVQSCLQNLTKQYCQCVQPMLPFDAINNTEDLSVCYECSKIPKSELRNACGCKRPCRYSEYDIKLLRQPGKFAGQDAEKYRTAVMGKMAMQENMFVKQLGLSLITVKMGSYNVEVVRETAVYEVETLLGRIGGILGLYLGISVLTLCKFAVASMHFFVGCASKMYKVISK